MAKRTTVTLDDVDQKVIERFADPERAEWTELVGSATRHGLTVKPGVSEGTVIRALLRAGADALREAALERGYAQLAEHWDEVHDADEAAERRRRYTQRVDRLTQA